MTPGVTGVPAGNSTSPRCASSPGSRHSRSGRGVPRDEVAVHGGLLDPDDRVGAGRHHGAGGDLTQVPSASSGARGRPGQHLSLIPPRRRRHAPPSRRRSTSGTPAGRSAGGGRRRASHRRTSASGRSTGDRAASPGAVADLARPRPRHGAVSTAVCGSTAGCTLTRPAYRGLRRHRSRSGPTAMAIREVADVPVSGRRRGAGRPRAPGSGRARPGRRGHRRWSRAG